MHCTKQRTKKAENTDNHELKFPIKDHTNKYQVSQMVTKLPTRTTATSSTQHIVQSVQKHIKNVHSDQDCLGQQWLTSFVADAISTE